MQYHNKKSAYHTININLNIDIIFAEDNRLYMKKNLSLPISYFIWTCDKKCYIIFLDIMKLYHQKNFTKNVKIDDGILEPGT